MGGTRLFVGGLPYHISKRDLERFFKGFGHIREILIKTGYGFVEFENQRDADDAVYELNGTKLLGERVKVERAHGLPRGRNPYGGGERGGERGRRPRSRERTAHGPPTRTHYRVIVENLSSRISWQDLKDYMREAGEVTFADAHRDHRNEGIVEFASGADMEKAIEKFDGAELNGRQLKVYRHKRGRSASGESRSRSRSRRRSRSSSRDRSRSKSAKRSPEERRSKSASVGRRSRSASKSD